MYTLCVSGRGTSFRFVSCFITKREESLRAELFLEAAFGMAMNARRKKVLNEIDATRRDKRNGERFQLTFTKLISSY